MLDHLKSRLQFAGRNTLVKSSATAMLLVITGALMGSGQALAQGANSTAVTKLNGNPSSACTDGTSTEDRATCLKEVAAAQAEARRGRLDDSRSNYSQNSVQRCQVLPSADQEACRLRATGQGATSGSVANGGVIREVVVPDNAPPRQGGMEYPSPSPGMSDGQR